VQGLALVVWIAGVLLLAALFVWTQFSFYKAHRARYGWWRSRYDFFLDGSAGTNNEAAIRAHIHRADDPAVERLRRLTLLTWPLPLIWFIGFPLVLYFLGKLANP
jgi:hypothetical protein